MFRCLKIKKSPCIRARKSQNSDPDLPQLLLPVRIFTTLCWMLRGDPLLVLRRLAINAWICMHVKPYTYT